MENAFIITIDSRVYTVKVGNVSRFPTLVEVNGQFFEVEPEERPQQRS